VGQACRSAILDALPQPFDLTLRGYDRGQVDLAVSTLTEQLS
jgi:hypothetical protein